jgi:hypothetical protein
MACSHHRAVGFRAFHEGFQRAIRAQLSSLIERESRLAGDVTNAPFSLLADTDCVTDYRPRRGGKSSSPLALHSEPVRPSDGTRCPVQVAQPEASVPCRPTAPSGSRRTTG